MVYSKILLNNRRNLDYESWTDINWSKILRQVTKLRSQIYLAKLRNDEFRLRELQRIAIRSNSNLLYSIRRVTSINRGKQTGGIDSLVYLTPTKRLNLYRELISYNIVEWKPPPVLRQHIPKPGKKKPRPLGIPTVKDRVFQMVVKNALEPEWEAQFEHSSYGFRPARGTRDAMNRIFRIVSSKKRKWVLDADIRGCFDNIAHEPLLTSLGDFPAKELINRWLKAGYFENESFHTTPLGTPQGGIVSPLLANIALHGMEDILKVRYHKDGYVRSECPFVVVRYADDFIILGNSHEEMLEAKNLLIPWLKTRGLEMAEDKSEIRHTTDGFDFLGWNFRIKPNIQSKSKPWHRAKGKYVTLVTPSQKSIASIKEKLGDLFRKYIGQETRNLIDKANPIIRGWANYHKVVNANETFRELDNFLYEQTVRYARRRHPNKSWTWIKSRYFTTSTKYRRTKTGKISQTINNWTFHATLGSRRWDLLTFRSSELINYYNPNYGRNPLHPADREYYNSRKVKLELQDAKKMVKTLHKRQNGICPECKRELLIEEGWNEPLHVHHILKRSLNVQWEVPTTPTT